MKESNELTSGYLIWQNETKGDNMTSNFDALFVRAVLESTQQDIYIRANRIRTVEKDPKNALLTLIIIEPFTPNGGVAYTVLDSQEAIMRQIWGGPIMDTETPNLPQIATPS